ncbi:helicase HerA domain-containing protein [Caproiciproducens galactitolivorans]|uniref:helicase HerA domain-containing protein n=1 Tax=Caproiciproducens galactitolivorans TaxID=642589 RepID=UPI002409EAD5|nr:DUF87 domain-containing protein [Caproiciproducens galactitolivorans]
MFWDGALLRQGCQFPVNWDYVHCPHALCVGPTGSGKTYAEKLILGRIAKYIPNAKITVLDFKADDYNFLRGCGGHCEFIDCVQGLDNFYHAFLARMQGNNLDRSFRLVVIEELSSLLNTLDKKEAEAVKRQVATLLMLGRSFNFHVLVSQQRADASYFAAGARDNFSIMILMGNVSREAATMAGVSKDELQPISGIGAGYMLTNGTDLREIQVPTVRNFARLEDAIRAIVK